MIDSLTAGGIVLEKDVPDMIDSENNLIYDLKTMTNSRLKDKKVEVIDMDIGKGGVHLLDNLMSINDETDKEIRKMYQLIDRHPLKRDDRVDAFQYMSCFTPTYFGVDFSKAPDCAGRVTFWVSPFKYKTAGFDHCTVNSDFGWTWRLHNWPGLDLKDLPIQYNFEMAKEFYKNWVEELFNDFTKNLKSIVNSIYGKYIYTLLDHRLMQYMQYTPGVQLDLFNWIFGGRMNGKDYICKNRRRYFYIARGATKHV